MDEDLKTYLAGMERRQREYIDERTHEAETRILEHTHAAETRILERTQEMVRDAQTEILPGFDHYQSGVQIRLRSLEAETSNLKTAQELRLANHEERISAIEMKLLRGKEGTSQ